MEYGWTLDYIDNIDAIKAIHMIITAKRRRANYEIRFIQSNTLLTNGVKDALDKIYPMYEMLPPKYQNLGNGKMEEISDEEFEKLKQRNRGS